MVMQVTVPQKVGECPGGKRRTEQATTRRAVIVPAMMGAAASTALAACVPAAPQGPAGADRKTRPFVALEYWTFMPTETRVPARKELFPEFEAQFNTRIETNDALGGWEEKIQASWAAGVLPDLIDPNRPSSLNDWAQRGMFEPVDRVLAALGRDDFYEPARVAVTSGGKLYGVPYIGFPQILYYRKDWYQRRGLKDPPKTWDDLLQNAQALHGVSPDGQEVAGFAGFFDKSQGWLLWQDFVGPNGGETFDRQGKLHVNTPNVLEALVLIDRLVPLMQAGAATAGYGANNGPFTQGKLAHHISSSSLAHALANSAPELAPHIGAIPIPQGPRGKGDRGGYNGIAYLCYTTLSKYKDRCEEFLKWFFSKEIHLRLFAGIDRGLLPMRNSVGKSAEYLNYPHLQAVKTIVAAGVQAQPIATLIAEDHGPNPLAFNLWAADCHVNMTKSLYLRQAAPRQALDTGEACMRGAIQTRS
ncbi:MAG: extracellular solute-binding protein [Armatimonadetes bacterium]|nr:extracellular solute-binding protein [Armatimonadota bacterium]